MKITTIAAIILAFGAIPYLVAMEQSLSPDPIARQATQTAEYRRDLRISLKHRGKNRGSSCFGLLGETPERTWTVREQIERTGTPVIPEDGLQSPVVGIEDGQEPTGVAIIFARYINAATGTSGSQRAYIFRQHFGQ